MSDYLDTTRAERLTIAKIVDPSMLDIDTASKIELSGINVKLAHGVNYPFCFVRFCAVFLKGQ